MVILCSTYDHVIYVMAALQIAELRMAGPEVHAQTLCIGKLVQRTMTAPSCKSYV